MSSVETSGPLFDGRAPMIVGSFCDSATEDVAQAALVEVQGNLNESIRFPTPYYETQIRMRAIPKGHQVDDRGVIYGHWLEGTGSRNAPRTRFRGYASFRRAYMAIVARTDGYIRPAREHMMRRLNNG